MGQSCFFSRSVWGLHTYTYTSPVRITLTQPSIGKRDREYNTHLFSFQFYIRKMRIVKRVTKIVWFVYYILQKKIFYKLTTNVFFTFMSSTLFPCAVIIVRGKKRVQDLGRKQPQNQHGVMRMGLEDREQFLFCFFSYFDRKSNTSALTLHTHNVCTLCTQNMIMVIPGYHTVLAPLDFLSPGERKEKEDRTFFSKFKNIK